MFGPSPAGLPHAAVSDGLMTAKELHDSANNQRENYSMGEVQQILQQVTEERVIGEHIEALKRPMPSPFWTSLFLISQGALVFFSGSMWNQSRPARVMMVLTVVFVAVVSIWQLSRALLARDRMWRAVIQHEAPELYAKVKEPGA